jgi:tyrosine-protein phosphatase YwqE
MGILDFLKTNRLADYSFLGTDLHSHVLPGIDDGADSVETAVRLVEQLRALGFRRIIATPHTMSDFYPNTPETIRAALARLQAGLSERGLDPVVEAASEYYLDEYYLELLHREPLLTLPDRHVLVEMSFISPPPNLSELLFQTQARGYKPILAHPERYPYLSANKGVLKQLKDTGCLFQTNLLSLTGYYGKPTYRLAWELVEAGWIDLLGTDLHHERHAQALKAGLRTDELIRIAQKHAFRNVEWNEGGSV